MSYYVFGISSINFRIWLSLYVHILNIMLDENWEKILIGQRILFWTNKKLCSQFWTVEKIYQKIITNTFHVDIQYTYNIYLIFKREDIENISPAVPMKDSSNSNLTKKNLNLSLNLNFLNLNIFILLIYLIQ